MSHTPVCDLFDVALPCLFSTDLEFFNLFPILLTILTIRSLVVVVS